MCFMHTGFFSCFIALFLALHQINKNQSSTGIVILNLFLLFHCHKHHFGSSKPASQQLMLQYHLLCWIKFKRFPCSISKVESLKLCAEKALVTLSANTPNRALKKQIHFLPPLPAAIATAAASPARDVIRKLNIPFDMSEWSNTLWLHSFESLWKICSTDWKIPQLENITE